MAPLRGGGGIDFPVPCFVSTTGGTSGRLLTTRHLDLCGRAKHAGRRLRSGRHILRGPDQGPRLRSNLVTLRMNSGDSAEGLEDPFAKLEEAIVDKYLEEFPAYDAEQDSELLRKRAREAIENAQG